MKVWLSILVFFVAAGAAATDYCHWANGTCYALPSPLGCPFPSVINTVPCSVTTPTPTPTPAVTPAPTPGTEPQPTYTVQPFLAASDLPDPYTYVQAMSMQGNYLFGNGGKCCPGIDDPAGRECVFAINYNVSPPKFREIYCGGGASPDIWEMGTVQVSSTPSCPFILTGSQTRKPAVDALVPRFGTPNITATDQQAWSTCLRDPMTDQIQKQNMVFERDGYRLWIQGVVEYGGHRWVYVQYHHRPGVPEALWGFRLARFIWNDYWLKYEWAHTTYLPRPNNSEQDRSEGPRSAGGYPGIVMDTDGTLIYATGWWPDQENPTVKIMRSKDEGRTWSETGIVFNNPTGKYLTGCGWMHNGRGVVVRPWVLICTLVDGGRGPAELPSAWNAALIRVTGSRVPTAIGQKPVR